MPTERGEGAIRVGATGQRATGGARRFQRKAAVFGGWHEPDESRGSCPERGAAGGETPRADSANPHVRVCEGWGRQRPHLLGSAAFSATGAALDGANRSTASAKPFDRTDLRDIQPYVATPGRPRRAGSGGTRIRWAGKAASRSRRGRG